jgi:putative colanic acid biosynthesis UDP-glucose lipid carrier transferase
VLLAWRVAVRHILERLLERRGSTRDALIWGSGQTAAQLGEALRSGRTLGLRLADHIEPIASVDRLAESTSTDSSAAPLSQTESLELRARRGDYSVLYIVLGSLSKQEASDLIERLSDTTVSVYLVPDYFSMQLFRGRWTSLGRIPLLTVFDTADGSAGSWVKRMEDLVLGTLMLLLVSLPMMLIAAMVKLTSRGPVLSGLRYYDRIGQPITLWKFRTEKTKKTIPQQHHEDTANITPIGRLLRKSRLDELPLLINLIRGDISIVGPRLRETAYDCDDSRSLGSQRLRTRFKPGLLSCEQTASFREGSESSRSREAIDPILWYTRNWTPWLDLKIIWSSIWKAVS